MGVILDIPCEKVELRDPDKVTKFVSGWYFCNRKNTALRTPKIVVDTKDFKGQYIFLPVAAQGSRAMVDTNTYLFLVMEDDYGASFPGLNFIRVFVVPIGNHSEIQIEFVDYEYSTIVFYSKLIIDDRLDYFTPLTILEHPNDILTALAGFSLGGVMGYASKRA